MTGLLSAIFMVLHAYIASGFGIARVSPIAIDWHDGGYLYVAFDDGEVFAYNDQGRRVRDFYTESFFRPAEVVSARAHGTEVLFVSGFQGREGSIIEWDAVTGKMIRRIDTPDLAAGIDIDPGTTAPKHEHFLYVVSAVSSYVYSINLDEQSKPSQLTYIKVAKSLGPVVFDQSRNKLFVGDQATGALYEVDCATGEYTTVAVDLGNTISLALDHVSSTLYVASPRGRIAILRISNSSGKLSQPTYLETGMDKTIAISLAPNKLLYVATDFGIYRVSPTTGQKRELINNTEFPPAFLRHLLPAR